MGSSEKTSRLQSIKEQQQKVIIIIIICCNNYERNRASGWVELNCLQLYYTHTHIHTDKQQPL